MGKLTWGILGTGKIARTFAEALGKSKTGWLAAVGSRQKASAEEFAKQFGSIRAYGTYEQLLSDPTVEIVYISTPHPQHAEWCLKAARAKKHILCEKPMTMNLVEAQKVVAAARENGVFLMEAFMYRFHPQTARLVELIQAGAIGRVAGIQASFCCNTPFDRESRIFNHRLGGGGILDIGCYTTSIARLIAGAAIGEPFADPISLTGHGQLHPETGVDVHAVATALFPGSILATLAASLRLNRENGLRVYGSEGFLYVPNPFTPPFQGGKSRFFLQREGNAEPEEIVIDVPDYLFQLEADAVANALAEGKLECPLMTVADSLGNMAALDKWRESIGLVYENEKEGAG